MFKPILVATPRTGSTLVCQLLGDICKQTSDYKNDLQEYFSFDVGYQTSYAVGANQVITYDFKEDHTSNRWFGSYSQVPLLIKARTELLENNPHRYMLKIFANSFQTDRKYSTYITNMLMKRYDPVYLERQDVMTQFLSQLYLVQTNRYHWRPNEKAPTLKLKFDYATFIWFRQMIYNYKAAKRIWPGPVIVYEEFINRGADHKALVDILNIDTGGHYITPSVVKTVPTPYNVPYGEMLQNDATWKKHQQEVEDFCFKYTHNVT